VRVALIQSPFGTIGRRCVMQLGPPSSETPADARSGLASAGPSPFALRVPFSKPTLPSSILARTASRAPISVSLVMISHTYFPCAPNLAQVAPHVDLSGRIPISAPGVFAIVVSHIAFTHSQYIQQHVV
jgi:hypothetical protein